MVMAEEGDGCSELRSPRPIGVYSALLRSTYMHHVWHHDTAFVSLMSFRDRTFPAPHEHQMS
jgi:hypothetical protein